jgi:uncharacterized protein YdaU (DUF1376 family)
MSATPWMPLYIGDYRADTTHLSAAQHGAYLLLIMHYWQQGGLPDDDEQLARIACMTIQEWRKHRPVIRAFFGEGWRHKRIDHEIAAAKDRYDRRAKAGKKGNSARWSHRNAIALGSQPQPQSQHRNPSQGEVEPASQGMALPPGGPRLVVVGGQALEDDQ